MTFDITMYISGRTCEQGEDYLIEIDGDTLRQTQIFVFTHFNSNKKAFLKTAKVLLYFTEALTNTHAFTPYSGLSGKSPYTKTY